MIKTCTVCGREFDANTSGTLCSAECRAARHRERNRKWYAAKPDVYFKYCWERQLATELAYWNYLLDKYPGGAK